MNEDDFTKLLKYLQEFRKEVRDEFAKVHSRIETLHGADDALQKQVETQEQERLFANHQIDRHEDWIKQLAGNTKKQACSGGLAAFHVCPSGAWLASRLV